MRRILDSINRARAASQRARALGVTPEEVVQMGMLCAQLGITEEDITPMARLWLMTGD